MPYLTNINNRRSQLDKIIALMTELNVKARGDLNYILFKFAKYNISPSYNNYKEFIGELECCKLEIYRKLVAPYEEIKENENGII